MNSIHQLMTAILQTLKSLVRSFFFNDIKQIPSGWGLAEVGLSLDKKHQPMIDLHISIRSQRALFKSPFRTPKLPLRH